MGIQGITALSVNDAVLNKASAAVRSRRSRCEIPWKSKREWSLPTLGHSTHILADTGNAYTHTYMYTVMYVHISFQFPFWLRVFLAYLIMVFGQQQQRQGQEQRRRQQQHKERGWALDVAGHQSLMRTARHSKRTHTLHSSHRHTHANTTHPAK